MSSEICAGNAIVGSCKPDETSPKPTEDCEEKNGVALVGSKATSMSTEETAKNQDSLNSKNSNDVTVESGNTPSDLSTRARQADTEGHGSVVAAHYNTLQDSGLAERNKSRIFYLRNFNNWVKSMLINEYMDKICSGKTLGSPLRVMDMCCGKGGDLLKWRRGNATHLICTDLAATSVEQCQSRYSDLKSRNQRGYDPIFTAEFIAADCTKTRLRERFRDPSMELNLVSCQFAFHYCFESLPQAECMLQNAAECLKPGGYFIGTMPDAYEIVSRLQKSEGGTFGNELYNVTFEGELPDPLPLFGAKYNFHLEGVVDCPEFLVNFPTLVRLAKKFGLQLVAKEKFSDFYLKQKEEGRSLLGKMQAFETYPPFHEVPLLGNVAKGDYEHVEQYMQKSTGHRKVGTLSKPEWEAASLYLVFAFQKSKTLWSSDGKPEFEMNKEDVAASGSKKRELDDSSVPETKKKSKVEHDGNPAV